MEVRVWKRVFRGVCGCEEWVFLYKCLEVYIDSICRDGCMELCGGVC